MRGRPSPFGQGQSTVSALQRAQSRPGRRDSWRERSWPHRHVADIGPLRGAVRAGRPVLCGSVTVPRPRRGRTEAEYRCIEVPDVSEWIAGLWACAPLSLHERNMLQQGLVTMRTLAALRGRAGHRQRGSPTRVRAASAKLPWWERIDPPRGAPPWRAPWTSPSPAPPPSPALGRHRAPRHLAARDHRRTATTPSAPSSPAPVLGLASAAGPPTGPPPVRRARRGSSSPTPLPRRRRPPCIRVVDPAELAVDRLPAPTAPRSRARPSPTRCCWSAPTAGATAAAPSTAARSPGRSSRRRVGRLGVHPPRWPPLRPDGAGAAHRLPLRAARRRRCGPGAQGRGRRRDGAGPLPRADDVDAARPGGRARRAREATGLRDADALQVEPTTEQGPAGAELVTVAATDGRRWQVTVHPISCPGDRPVVLRCGGPARHRAERLAGASARVASGSWRRVPLPPSRRCSPRNPPSPSTPPSAPSPGWPATCSSRTPPRPTTPHAASIRPTSPCAATPGLLAVSVPTAEGGLGGDARVDAEVVERLSGACGATWFVLTQHQMPAGRRPRCARSGRPLGPRPGRRAARPGARVRTAPSRDRRRPPPTARSARGACGARRRGLAPDRRLRLVHGMGAHRRRDDRGYRSRRPDRPRPRARARRPGAARRHSAAAVGDGRHPHGPPDDRRPRGGPDDVLAVVDGAAWRAADDARTANVDARGGRPAAPDRRGPRGAGRRARPTRRRTRGLPPRRTRRRAARRRPTRCGSARLPRSALPSAPRCGASSRRSPCRPRTR